MMVVDKEDLGLSLSLSCNTKPTTTPSTVVIHGGLPHHPSPFHLNLMHPSLFTPSSSLPLSNPPFPSATNLHKPSWLDSFPSSDRTAGGASVAGSGDPRSFLRGIDVNRTPASAAAEDEEAGVSSPNSTISSGSGKRSERDVTVVGEDIDMERACSRGGGAGGSDDEDGDTSRKKLRLSKDQSNILEESFKEHNTLNPKQKLALAKRLGLRPRQVEVWFQNRRARTKLKQTEVDCEFLKRCCEQLTDDNRRLQKEVQELRALKLSPQFYMQMTPPTTLTMCPSCERVAAPPPSSASASAAASADARTGHGGHRHRGLPMNPWGVAAPVPIRQFEGLHPRS